MRWLWRAVVRTEGAREGQEGFGAEDVPAAENICAPLSAQMGWREEKARERMLGLMGRRPV